MAGATGCHLDTIRFLDSGWVRDGKQPRQYPSLHTFMKLCKVYDLDPIEWYDEWREYRASQDV